MAAERTKRGKTTGGKRAKKASTKKFAIEKRREQATKLRLAGWSMREIAAHLGCSVGLVHSDISDVLKRAQEKAEDYIERERAVSVARLEHAVKAIWPEVESGELDAVDRLVKLEARRGKVIGFDAPEKRELTGKDGGPIQVSPEAAAARVREIFGATGIPQESTPEDPERVPSGTPES